MGSTYMKTGSAFVLLAGLLLAAACAGPKVTDLTGGRTGGDGTPTPSSTTSNVTYYKDVKAILDVNCVNCHVDGGAAFALDSYAGAKSYAQPISAATTAKTMPPWPPDPACQHFQDERVLTEAQKATLAAWNTAGAPEGNPADATTNGYPQSASTLPATPDRLLDAGGDYTFDQAANQDLYWCFRLDPAIAANSDLIGADIAPGNPAIVHHVIVFREVNGAANATGLPGFKCDGAPGEFLFAWVPGSAPLKFPDGIGMRLAPTDRLLMQIHYHRSGAPNSVDRTKAKLYFSPTPVTQLAHVSWLGTPSITIPANSDATASGDCVVPNGADVKVLMTAPHMHTLATKFNATLHTAAGTDQCMIDVPKWDFGWQGGYMFPQPVTLHPGDRITSTCTWHNTTNAQVGFGEGTGSEMCFNFVYSVGPLPQYCFPGGAIFGAAAGGGF